MSWLNMVHMKGIWTIVISSARSCCAGWRVEGTRAIDNGHCVVNFGTGCIWRVREGRE